MLLSSQSILKEKIELLLEKSPSDTLVQVFGLDPESAKAIENIAGKLSVWAVDTYLNDAMIRVNNEMGTNIKSKKEIMQMLSPSRLVRFLSSVIPSIKDWMASKQREGQPINIKSFNSIDKAYEEAENWHKSLLAEDEVPFEFEGEEIIEYPEQNGVIYYWEDLQTNNSRTESSRMGHCGHSPKSTTLISLRSRRYVPEKKAWVSSSHITIGLNENNGVTYQIKGKNNSKPTDKYHPYIVDLLIEKTEIKDFGTEYSPKNDFKISDLDESLKKKLLRGKPSLFKAVYVQLIEMIENPKTTVKKIVNFIEKNKKEIKKDLTTQMALINILKEKSKNGGLSKASQEAINKSLLDLRTIQYEADSYNISYIYLRDYRNYVKNFIDNYWNDDSADWSGNTSFKDVFQDVDDMVYNFITKLLTKYPWVNNKLLNEPLDIETMTIDGDIYYAIKDESLFEDIKHSYFLADEDASAQSFTHSIQESILYDLSQLPGVTNVSIDGRGAILDIDVSEIVDIIEENGADSDDPDSVFNVILENIDLNNLDTNYRGYNTSDFEEILRSRLNDAFSNVLIQVEKEQYRDQPNLPFPK
jgi:hypothetical protein